MPIASAALVPPPTLVIAGAAAPHEGHPPPPDWQDFEKVALTQQVGEPMSMAVLPDRRVLHTNRQGQVRLFDPQTERTRIITSLPVYQFSEDRMQGIALDPDFADNHWVYVYYAPVIEDSPPVRKRNRSSRATTPASSTSSPATSNSPGSGSSTIRATSGEGAHAKS